MPPPADHGPGRRPLLLGAATAATALAAAPPVRPAVAQGGGRRVPLGVSARPAPDAPAFHAEDFGAIGILDVDWVPEARFVRLLDHVASAPPGCFRYVRVFGALNSGARESVFPGDDVGDAPRGRTWPDASAPMDFSATFAALDAITARGLTPFLPLTFMPPAVAPAPNAPPTDLALWRRLVAGFLTACAERYGRAALADWWFEAWNEPNMPPFWSGTFDDYLALYRATSEAVASTGLDIRLGGPVVAYMPGGGEGRALTERFLEFLRDEPGLRCDFVSLHRKGIWAAGEHEPRVERLLDAAEDTARAALRLVPERCARGLVVVNDEADMRVAFAEPYPPRMDERFPSWLSAVAATHADLTARYASRGLRFVAAADNANQNLLRAPFDGRRSLATPTDAAPDDLVKLPVFAFYELLGLLGDRLAAWEPLADDAPLFPRGPVFRLATVAEDRVAVLLARHPAGPDDPRRADGAWPRGEDAGEPLTVDLALRDLPWPRVNLARFRVDADHTNAHAAVGRAVPARVDPVADARRLREAAELGVLAPIARGVAVEAGGTLRVAVPLPGPASAALVWATPHRPDAPPPAAPRWLSARAEHGNAVLRWTPSAERSFYGYEVVRLPSPGASPGGPGSVPVAPVPLRGAMWVDTAPPMGREHAYAVRAVDASGVAGPWSVGPAVRVG